MKKFNILLFLVLNCTLVNAQTWSALGSGVNDIVYCMTEHNGKLYAGGTFEVAGGIPCYKIASWDGINWDSIPLVPPGDSNISINQVYSLESWNGNLYMSRITPPHFHYEWNNNAWSAIGLLNGVSLDMMEYNNELYFGGGFTTINGSANPALFVAKYNGTSFSSAGSTFQNFVTCFALYNGELYAGGSFFGEVAKWDGNNWLQAGAGISNNTVNSMAVYNGELIVAGDFNIAGGLPASNIATWNGTSWSNALGNIIGDAVYSLAVYNGELYAAGHFTSAGGLPVNNIAKWNGTSWSALGAGITGFYPHVYSMQTYNGDLYVGGWFSNAGTVVANDIAKWNTPTGISEPIFANQPTLSPNPTTGNFTITFPSTINKGTIEVYNTIGAKLYSQNISNSSTTNIQLNNFARGIYFVKVNDSERQFCQKIVIE